MISRSFKKITVLCLLLFSIGCTRGSESVPLEGGELIFSEDFESGSLNSEAWKSNGEFWTIEDGVLRGEGAQNDALWLTTELPEQVRIEFKARAFSNDGDLKFEVFGDGATHESGYIGIFGGWGNRLNIIARLDEHGDDRKVGADGVRVEANRWYDFALVRTGTTLHWFVDGEPFMTYRDAAPLRGSGHEHFAFNDWEAAVGFDDVRIYNLGVEDE